MAEMAAMSFSPMLLKDNLNMQWSGYHDSLGVFVQKTLEIIIGMRGKEFKDIFEQVKSKKLQDLASFYLS